MHRVKNESAAEKMLSFSSNSSCSAPWDHHPAVSSPLSSSPVRASSPLSPVDENARYQRLTQSSPIKPIKFKYESRSTRPNPVVRRREEVQEHRRKSFLHNVRQKADDKVWQRRDIEGHSLKTNWLANIVRLSRDAPSLSEADIEDAMIFQQNTAQFQNADKITEEEEMELTIASNEEQQGMSSQRPPSPALPDDDEYDDIFAELLSQERPLSTQPSAFPSQMDMSD